MLMIQNIILWFIKDQFYKTELQKYQIKKNTNKRKKKRLEVEKKRLEGPNKKRYK